MISEEFLEILRKYGEVTIKHLPPVEESHLGSWDESVVFEVQTEHGRAGSGAYVMKGLDATLEDDSLDGLAERLAAGVESIKRLHEHYKSGLGEAPEEWKVERTWLSET